jgi:hypothetical protein
MLRLRNKAPRRAIVARYADKPIKPIRSLCMTPFAVRRVDCHER